MAKIEYGASNHTAKQGSFGVGEWGWACTANSVLLFVFLSICAVVFGHGASALLNAAMPIIAPLSIIGGVTYTVLNYFFGSGRGH